MSTTEEIQQRLQLWEELLEQGHRPDPAALCADRPELLARLRQGMQALQSIDQ